MSARRRSPGEGGITERAPGVWQLLATVVFHAPDGTVLVETPWSSAHHRYDAADLTLLLAAEA